MAATYHVGQTVFYGGRQGKVIRVGGGLVTVYFQGWMTITFRAFQLG
jgi:hypothetical protein